jgi:(R,R)-butanediol dehydrogenase/meso-butanediol dehydrogenase/diacetyl reductase
VRAATYVGDKTLTVIEQEPRSPEAGEVQIEVAYTGICGTDLHILHGAMDARVTMPAVLGHEMSGTITRLGADVSGWSIGDRVTDMPLDWCGHCPACLSGNTHICHNLNFLGIDSAGSMQGSWTVPARSLISLPSSLSLEAGALAEPAAVAVHDVRRADLKAGEKAVVVGGGPIGVLIACAARAVGAEILVLELSESRRAFIDGLGLRAVDPTDGDVQALITEWTEGAGADVAFEVSGAPAGLETAIMGLAVRGRLVVVAIYPTPPPVNLFRFFWRELTLIGARLYQRQDFDEAVRLIEAGTIPAEAMITRVDPLSDVAAAFAELESGRAMKMLIDCQAGS